MRRNTVRLLKYLIVAALFIGLGPLAVRLMFGGGGADHGSRLHGDVGHIVVLEHEAAGAQGMPVDPDDMPKVHHEVAAVDDGGVRATPKKIALPEIAKNEVAEPIDPTQKIDWHDYAAIALEEQRTGQLNCLF